MEAAIRFSRNSLPGNTSSDDRFLHVDVSGKHFQLCRITSRSSKKSLKYEAVAISGPKVPAFRAFDWHPTLENLVVVGQTSGEATLLSLGPSDSNTSSNEGKQVQSPGTTNSISFNIRSQRPSNAVSLSSQDLLAAGLDRVRTDFCLNIWDFTQRLPSPSAPSNQPFAFSKHQTSQIPEPLHKLAPGEPITSLKFFQDSPSLLVAGVKGQFVRLYDLRDPASSSPGTTGTPNAGGANAGLQFPTRCVHNLAIDWQDENYFASCYPSGDTQVCLWDRRMHSRSVSSTTTTASFGSTDAKAPEVSLELNHNIGDPKETIWSLRFAKSRRGCLGVLSSAGHVKIYEVGKDFEEQNEAYTFRGTSDINHNQFRSRDPQVTLTQESWETHAPQDIYLDRTQDMRQSSGTSKGEKPDPKSRVVSFDFTTKMNSLRQPEIITLTGDGEIGITAPTPLPEPASFSPTGFFVKGNNHYIQESSAGTSAQSQSVHSQQDRDKRSSIDTMQQDTLHPDPASTPLTLPQILSYSTTPLHRCKQGYLLHPSTNRTLVASSPPLRTLWSWLDRAARISSGNKMVADNFDLSHLGVFSLWMEDLNADAIITRTLGPAPPPTSPAPSIRRSASPAGLAGGSSSSRFPLAIAHLTRRLSLPANRSAHTEHKLNRQICLHVSGLSWSAGELEGWTKKLVEKGEFSKAAFLALVSAERTLVHRVLRSPGAGGRERMLGVVIAGAERRKSSTSSSSGSGVEKGKARIGERRPSSDEEDSDSDDTTDDNGLPDQDDTWSSTIEEHSADLTDPYARAILAYVKSNDWADVLDQTGLPLKYRVCVALRHLDDSRLTKYISQTTKEVIQKGDVEGVILTGTAVREAFDLMTNYVAESGDVQSAVLALAGTVPRYVSDAGVVRKFEAWKNAYRGMMNSWGCRMERVRFDIAVQKVAVENGTGRRLIRPGKAQVRLVCAYCAGSVAHHDVEGGSVEEGNGAAVKMHDTQRNPLTAAAAAAAMGTVCPRCERRLPRCGVCDLWLGTGDESYLKHYGAKQKGEKNSTSASVDMSGSTHTVIGPERSPARAGGTMAGSKKGSLAGSADVRVQLDGKDMGEVLEEVSSTAAAAVIEDSNAERLRKSDEMMARFTVFCVKCSHAFHAAHARMWFRGDPAEGRKGHSICPVPRCDCVCYD